jgi:Fur family ferric uptake transcriptional regulator
MIRNRNMDNPIHGRPLTSQRRLLLELLRDAEGHIDAKELYRRADIRDDSISMATVYRTLNLFRELGLVDERKLGKECCCYELKKSSEHHHLVCQKCGKVIEFQDPHFQKLIKTLQREYGFKITKAELCLEGCCPECEDKAEKDD